MFLWLRPIARYFFPHLFLHIYLPTIHPPQGSVWSTPVFFQLSEPRKPWKTLERHFLIYKARFPRLLFCNDFKHLNLGNKPFSTVLPFSRFLFNGFKCLNLGKAKYRGSFHGSMVLPIIFQGSTPFVFSHHGDPWLRNKPSLSHCLGRFRRFPASQQPSG